MSNNLKPWLRQYLLNTAENHGFDLSKSYVKRAQQVQLIELLFPLKGEANSNVWLRASDTSHHIPIRFQQSAVEAYVRTSGRQLADSKSVLVTIREFKIMLSRVPSGGIMSQEPHLALDCSSVSLVGAVDEPTWGDPQEVENDGNLSEWKLGLDKGGGAGNILRDRKNALNKPSTTLNSESQKHRKAADQPKKSLPAPRRIADTKSGSESRKKDSNAASSDHSHDEHTKKMGAIFSKYIQDPGSWTTIPDDMAHLLNLTKIEGDSPDSLSEDESSSLPPHSLADTPRSTRSATPISSWSATVSPTSSPPTASSPLVAAKPQLYVESTSSPTFHASTAGSHELKESIASQLSTSTATLPMPTPAQRPRPEHDRPMRGIAYEGNTQSLLASQGSSVETGIDKLCDIPVPQSKRRRRVSLPDPPSIPRSSQLPKVLVPESQSTNASYNHQMAASDPGSLFSEDSLASEDDLPFEEREQTVPAGLFEQPTVSSDIKNDPAPEEAIPPSQSSVSVQLVAHDPDAWKLPSFKKIPHLLQNSSHKRPRDTEAGLGRPQEVVKKLKMAGAAINSKVNKLPRESLAVSLTTERLTPPWLGWLEVHAILQRTINHRRQGQSGL